MKKPTQPLDSHRLNWELFKLLITVNLALLKLLIVIAKI